MSDTEQLRALHDHYAWEVNAAVGEGRLDLVWRLADEYVDRSLELLTDGEPTGCGIADCAVCQRPRPQHSGSRRRRWFRRTHIADAS